MAGASRATGPDEIVAEIERTREHLAATVDTLADRVNPKNAARRGVGNLKAKFVDPDGSPRLQTILPVAGGVVGLVVLVVVIRTLVKD